MMKNNFLASLFNPDNLKLFYARNKRLLVPIFIIIICLILLLKVVSPQFADYLKERKDIEATRQRIGVLEANLSLLSKIGNTQGSDLILVSKALPTEKDFAAVLQAISKASVSSGTELGDFTFEVGELSTASASTSRPSLDLVLALEGANPVSMVNFLKELSKTLPVTEVSEADLRGNTSNIGTSFYYRPLAQTKLDYTIPLVPLNNSETELLKTLSSWNAPSFTPPVSSASASPSAF